MRYLYFILAILTLTTSCELRSTNFDPDNQFVSEDELAQISLWDQYQSKQLNATEYESLNPKEFIHTECDYRQNSNGMWVIEGSIQNSASSVNFQDAELSILYFNESNTLIGSEKYTVYQNLAPGDHAGFYLKSDEFKEAHSLRIKINRITPIK
jgi:hypothetical protein